MYKENEWDIAKNGFNSLNMTIGGLSLNESVLELFKNECKAINENPWVTINALKKLKQQRLAKGEFNKLKIIEILGLIKELGGIKFQEYKDCINCDGYGHITTVKNGYEYDSACDCENGQKLVGVNKSKEMAGFTRKQMVN